MKPASLTHAKKLATATPGDLTSYLRLMLENPSQEGIDILREAKRLAKEAGKEGNATKIGNATTSMAEEMLRQAREAKSEKPAKAQSTKSKAQGTLTPAEYAVGLAQHESKQAEAAIRKSCGHALVCGLALAWLHQNAVADKTSNLRQGTTTVVTTADRDGFAAKLEAIELPRPTAYRWINAAAAAASRLDLDMANLPEPGTDEWSNWVDALRSTGEGMSLRRLMLGMVKEGTEEARYDELIDRAEQDDPNAEAALQAVAEGRYTLVMAMRAAAGAQATAGKSRRDPVYLALDGRTGAVKGLVPKALITLNNAFHRWEQLDAPARKAVRAAWVELVSHLPEELV